MRLFIILLIVPILFLLAYCHVSEVREYDEITFTPPSLSIIITTPIQDSTISGTVSFDGYAFSDNHKVLGFDYRVDEEPWRPISANFTSALATSTASFSLPIDTVKYKNRSHIFSVRAYESDTGNIQEEAVVAYIENTIDISVDMLQSGTNIFTYPLDPTNTTTPTVTLPISINGVVSGSRIPTDVNSQHVFFIIDGIYNGQFYPDGNLATGNGSYAGTSGGYTFLVTGQNGQPSLGAGIHHIQIIVEDPYDPQNRDVEDVWIYIYVPDGFVTVSIINPSSGIDNLTGLLNTDGTALSTVGTITSVLVSIDNINVSSPPINAVVTGFETWSLTGLNTGYFTNHEHSLTVTATDNLGNSGSYTIPINIQNTFYIDIIYPTLTTPTKSDLDYVVTMYCTYPPTGNLIGTWDVDMVLSSYTNPVTIPGASVFPFTFTITETPAQWGLHVASESHTFGIAVIDPNVGFSHQTTSNIREFFIP